MIQRLAARSNGSASASRSISSGSWTLVFSSTDSANAAQVADEHIVGKYLPKLDFQFFRVRTQQDGAHPHSTAGNEHLAEITGSDRELDGLDCVDRLMLGDVIGGDDVHLCLP
jgi:hypothetical protein